MRRLRAALAGRKTVWSGCPLEPEVLLRLARNPPATAPALADVLGVGPTIAAQLGGLILAALSDNGAPAPPAADNGVLSALDHWRTDVAHRMGLPPFQVITDAVLRAIAEARPQSRSELARIRGVGPRALAKFADDLLSFFPAVPATPDHEVPGRLDRVASTG
jgi:predicted flap endonuclease-1-like 5' DNA nuclease